MKKTTLTQTQLNKYVPQTITLPSLAVNNYNIRSTMRKKKPNLKLVTSTSVNKENKDKSDVDRPATATLERPQILDIRFIHKIDMSVIKKEFLSITNLCRAPLTVIKVIDQRGICERPVSLPSTNDKSVGKISSKRSKTSLSTNEADLKKITPRRGHSKGFFKKASKDSNNNEKLAKIDKGKTPNDNKRSIKLPQPCTTCGRPDQPERFHSHPVTPVKPTKKMWEPEKVPVKSTVQKPMAMKYKSKGGDKAAEVESERAAESSKRASRPKSGKVPKMLMCYICGRDFGTASLPLHEPKCLEKWQRENANLPLSQRRKTPTKPDVLMSSDRWNQCAWESCQVSKNELKLKFWVDA